MLSAQIPVPVTFWKGLKEISLFSRGKDEVHKTTRRLVRRLEKAGIPYAVVGGMAAYYHRYRRTTDDVDILLARAGFDAFRKKFVPKCYLPHSNLYKRFTDRVNDVTIDILITGLFPGSGEPGPFADPNPAEASQPIETIQIVTLPSLIALKLAARRHQDFADVVNLIRHNNLDEPFPEKLPQAVRGDYIERLEEKRREDEYAIRQDRAGEELSP
jgi:hypothetical protein